MFPAGKRFLILRIIAPVLFAAGGIFLLLLSLLGAPSFSYIPCFGALPVIAAFWAWRPRTGAALSIGPLIGLIAILSYLSGPWLVSGIICVAIWLLFLGLAAKESGGVSIIPLIVSLGFLSICFLIGRLFTNKVVIRTYSARVAIDGNAPWGMVGAEWSDGVKPIVLYRRVGDSYCYVAFKSDELRRRLVSRHTDSVPIEINVFKDFGTERGYNVRSVDGLLLANGQHVVVDAERFGGQILGPSNSSAECW